MFGQATRKRFLLNAKKFSFEYLKKNPKQINKISRYMYHKRSISVVRIAKYGLLREPNQHVPFHFGPLRPYHKFKCGIFSLVSVKLQTSKFHGWCPKKE